MSGSIDVDVDDDDDDEGGGFGGAAGVESRRRATFGTRLTPNLLALHTLTAPVVELTLPIIVLIMTTISK
jgi:hypothetical protein